MEKKAYVANKKRVAVTMADGKVFQGVVNIGEHERLSDIFMSGESDFIILYEMDLYDIDKKSVFFINKSHIRYAQPLENE